MAVLHPPELKSRVVHEINCELERVIDLIAHFTEYDQDLKQKSYEVGAWFNDPIGVSFPDRILDDDA